jgi:hypothetical protein
MAVISAVQSMLFAGIAAFSPVEGDETGELLLDAPDVRLHLLDGEHGPLPHVTGVTDHAGGAACHDDGGVPRTLEPGQHEEGDEVARVKRRACRVEPDVRRRRCVQFLAQRVQVSGLRDEPAPLQVVEDIALLGHS